MPRCVHCFARVSALTTKYGEHHIVLAQCPACSKLADPYLERDATIIFIDLLLLKLGVYRHFLWNRARQGKSVARFTLLLLILETLLDTPDGQPLPRIERFALLQLIWMLSLHGFANLLVDLFRPSDLPITLLQPSLALLIASLTKLATLFLALVFRREFLDSSSDLRPLLYTLRQYLPSVSDRLPTLLQSERTWVLDANGLKSVLVRGGLGATSAIIAFSALLDAGFLTSALVLLLAWTPSVALHSLAQSRIAL